MLSKLDSYSRACLISPGGSDIHLLSGCLGLWESCDPMAGVSSVQYEMKDPVTLVGWDTVLIKWISRISIYWVLLQLSFPALDSTRVCEEKAVAVAVLSL